MRVDVSREALASHGGPLLVVPLTKDPDPAGPVSALDEELDGALSRAMAAGDFQGRKDDRLLVHGRGNGPERVLFGTDSSSVPAPDSKPVPTT